jgi:hypothetical protein
VERIDMKFAGRLALRSHDFVHLLHAFYQFIKKLAQGYFQFSMIVPTSSVRTIYLHSVRQALSSPSCVVGQLASGRGRPASAGKARG